MDEGAVRAIWTLICSGDRSLDPDDLIMILETHGHPCPEDLAEMWG